MCSTGQQQFSVAVCWSWVLGFDEVGCINAYDWSLLLMAQVLMGW